MATTETVRKPAALRRHRTIERPRLFKLLDSSNARVRVLVAPAGYGKTTLAEQWVSRDGRRGAWFAARPSATDVAALALGLARSASAIVSGCDARLRAHLRALPAAAENVETLAEILSEDLATWPADTWLVVDDYQEIAQEERAEAFVGALFALAPVHLLIASRVRPSWIRPKMLMYGDAFEIALSDLAMDGEEAAEVLVGRSAHSVSGLASLANGWPAVIGLASASAAEVDDRSGQVPESLYRYFADEVFSALGSDVQRGLTTLAVAPVLDRELAVRLLARDMAERVCTAALSVGLLVERGNQLVLHPLARAFLEERVSQLGLLPDRHVADVCLEWYRAHHDWDAAFELIVRTSAISELESVARDALDELVDTARLSTLKKWCDLAAEAGTDAPIFAVGRAEVMLREGRHAEAAAHAEEAASSARDLEYRGLSLAGRAAHLASHEDDALSLYRRAETAASSELDVRDAKWGQLMCLIELERPEAHELLHELEAGVRLVDAQDTLRAATNRLSYQMKLGDLDLYDADLAAALARSVSDPLVVSSFQSVYSVVLGLVGRYEEAIEVAHEFQHAIRRYRLDFAMPYALCAASLAEAGLRQWLASERDVSTAFELARKARDGHAQQLCFAQWIRVLVQQGRVYEALDLEVPQPRTPLPAAQAEVLGSRALALATAGRTTDARRVIDQARGLSRAVEPAVLIAATDAICGLKEHSSDALDRVANLQEVAFRRGALDVLVTSYRASPELLRVLLRVEGGGEPRIGRLLRQVQDVDLAEASGYAVPGSGDRRNALSPREREVYDLLIRDLTNREIAKLLFIEESTVKVHTHHIYDKLGVRSRRALIVQAMLERSPQATSATPSSSDES